MSTESDTTTELPITPIKTFGAMGLYWADSLDALEKIEATGVKIYYVLGQEKLTTMENNVTKTFHSPNIFRVEKSILGRSILHADPKDLNLFSQIETSVIYSLPRMPYEFVQRADAFFRLAHKVHGTESVLVLTYDPSYFGSENPSQGWGILVPDQENTAANCKYDLQSVMEHKPDDVYIVGSWHSHPEMAAYFSSTDHHDQDDWDGIHITTGWKSNGPSEFHIALVMSGCNWTYKPEQIFSSPPPPKFNSDGIEEMVGKVKKKVHTTTNYSNSTLAGVGINGVVAGTAYPNNRQHNMPNVQTRTIKLPPDAPNPKEVTIIACLDPLDVNHKCPFCSVPLTDSVWDSNRCIACHSFFINPNETIAEMVEKRNKAGKPYVTAIDPAKATNPIVLWYPAKLGEDDIFTQDMRDLVEGTTPPKS